MALQNIDTLVSDNLVKFWLIFEQSTNMSLMQAPSIVFHFQMHWYKKNLTTYLGILDVD